MDMLELRDLVELDGDSVVGCLDDWYNEGCEGTAWESTLTTSITPSSYSSGITCNVRPLREDVEEGGERWITPRLLWDWDDTLCEVVEGRAERGEMRAERLRFVFSWRKLSFEKTAGKSVGERGRKSKGKLLTRCHIRCRQRRSSSNSIC
jgi:hypothetical protein